MGCMPSSGSVTSDQAGEDWTAVSGVLDCVVPDPVLPGCVEVAFSVVPDCPALPDFPVVDGPDDGAVVRCDAGEETPASTAITTIAGRHDRSTQSVLPLPPGTRSPAPQAVDGTTGPLVVVR